MRLSGRLEEIPEGAPGLRVKMERMRSLVERAKADPNFRATIASRVRGLRPRDHDGEIRSVVDMVRGRMRYLRDPSGLEAFTDPRVLWEGMAQGRGVAQGDCDDHVLAASAALETLGYPTRYAVGGPGPGRYRHVWLEVDHPRNGWTPIELTRNLPIGYDPSRNFSHVETHLGAAPPIPRHRVRPGLGIGIPTMSRISALQPFQFGGPAYHVFTPGDILRMSNALSGMTGPEMRMYHVARQRARGFQRMAARQSSRRIATNPAFSPIAVRSRYEGARVDTGVSRVYGPPPIVARTIAPLPIAAAARYFGARGLRDYDDEDALGGFGSIFKKAAKSLHSVGQAIKPIVPKPVQSAGKAIGKFVAKVPGAGIPLLALPLAPLAMATQAVPLLSSGFSGITGGAASVTAPMAIFAPKPGKVALRDAPIVAAIAVGAPLIAAGGAAAITGASGITGAVLDSAGGGGVAPYVPAPVANGQPFLASMGGSSVLWLTFAAAGIAFALLKSKRK